ncbi:MAG: damage-control phosphatase, subfamily [Candidatus Sumerlaeota bacterium]|nr:damage-control phosphatase, subfamily [Candidatus Sumerlaeota bacterium]
MKTTLDCIPCIIRQALDAARFVTDDVAAHERILRDVLRETAEIDLSQSPPVVGQKMHRQLRQLTGIADPYRKAKDQFNKLALEMVSELEADIAKSADPLYLALRLAIAGNVIDLGVKGGIGDGEVRKAIRNTLNEPFHGDMEDFRLATGQAQSILYLADNAGEIVFDRLLIEQLLPARVTVAVRGGPVLNDALREDAKVAGLCRLVEVIDNGSDAPGTVLEDCSEPFRRRFDEADLIIAKGQGNFETLSESETDIYFLFKAKCPVIAARVGLPVGTHVAMHRGTRFRDENASPLHWVSTT